MEFKSYSVLVRDEIVKIKFCVPSDGGSKMNSSNEICFEVGEK